MVKPEVAEVLARVDPKTATPSVTDVPPATHYLESSIRPRCGPRPFVFDFGGYVCPPRSSDGIGEDSSAARRLAPT